MESAHLTRAHEHVRTAATATYEKSVATAGQEHHLAAAAFHDATQDTHNAEALRILNLLEDHHRKLAGLIKEAPRKDKKIDATKQSLEASTTSPASKAPSSRASASTTTVTPPTSRGRLPQSSIATNLAEKRGIPSTKKTNTGTASNVSAVQGGRNERLSTPVSHVLAQQSRTTDSTGSRDSTSQSRDTTSPPASPPAHDNFRRFYSAFGGVINALSAPLAFTSLPLIPPTTQPVAEPPKEERAHKPKSRAQSPEAARTVKSSVPDLASLISQPALRALRDDGAPPLGPNESFYLVPTTGRTVTYASVLRDPNAAPSTQLDAIDEASGSMKGSSHEEFVDARESLVESSPTKRRPRSRGNTGPGVTAQRSIPAGRGAGLKTLEELALENETLKSVIDKQAKRIQMWELNSQNSFNALAQSFRTRGPGRNTSDPNALAHALGQGANGLPALPSPPILGPMQPPATSPGPTSMTHDAAKRIADLEALLASQTAKVDDLMSNNEQLAKQNERNSQVLSRYREQWEKLKAGARKKEQERRERRMAEVRSGEAAKDSESGDASADVDGDADLEEEPGFGKA
ncbi:hypothetical protein LEMA_P105570.1 [Plenodomus lingam JN3]|uniref:Uncharacterized protein n=1 Tax=Leptosphaeria maculans (strain JN3 / isolate v23.1.3 / race Av1-4-5-6-7-8) TaxID=985895 RepID=E5A1G2_LEPMJ|nr:hypothetical protein LEMA_P105570.1 [Plenodomus lingam JN3]CBX97426.1 hypothetical protein LEMA_P105570.1 [Plenodomus lingam JN3]